MIDVSKRRQFVGICGPSEAITLSFHFVHTFDMHMYPPIPDILNRARMHLRFPEDLFPDPGLARRP